MNVLIAPDAFKDSLTASEVTLAMKAGVQAFHENARCFQITASDGGEGFLEAVASSLPDVDRITIPTVDPLGRLIEATYLFDSENKTAYVELARASGLELLDEHDRNPMYTSTYGTGLQIKHAIDNGATHVYLGIGGSATNDAGTGIASALGFRFLNSDGAELTPMGSTLSKIHSVEVPGTSYDHVQFFAVNDVLNPLFGPTGAAFTYARQKGAITAEIELLDAGLSHLDAVVTRLLNKNEAQRPGSGAAGGTAYGLRCFFEATYISGASFILQLSGFTNLVSEEKIEVILTGEGMIDHQTAFGKFVHGLCQEANNLDIPVLGICGKLDASPAEIEQIGLLAVAEIYDPAKPKLYSYNHAARLISEKTETLLMQFQKNRSIR